VRIEILDLAGRTVRDITSDVATGGAASGPDTRGPRRGGSTPARVPARPGINRFTWDLRHRGTWSASAQQGSGDGPLAAPGEYMVRLTVTRAGGTTTSSAKLDVAADPRVIASGVTLRDLEEQTDLLLKVRDAMGAARQLVEKLRTAREQSRDVAAKVAAIDGVLQRLVSAPGPYPQPMLIEQLGNVARMLGQADQAPGRDGRERFDDLQKEWEAVQKSAAALQ
jgi:hypothetical protein